MEEDTLELRDYIRILQRRWRMVVLCTLIGIGAAASLTLAAQKTYTSNLQMFVSAQDSGLGSTNTVGTAYQGGLFTQQRVKSYTNLIPSEHIASLVRDDLHLDESAADLSKQISATAPLDTVLLNVSVKDHDPARAQRIANSIGRIFPAFVTTLETPASGGSSPVKVSVSQAAELPKSPTSPRPNLALALGLVLGLGLGVGGAVTKELLDTSIKDLDQASELVGAPVIGTIAYDAAASRDPLVIATSPGSQRAEAFRQLRTNLQFVNIEHELRSVVITSSVAGEGKSTTTCNLALTLAEAGLRVVLVEADLRRPRVAEYMGLDGAVGLTSVLLGRVDLDVALQPWGDASLSVLASGPLPPNPSELLGSEGMLHLLQQLEGRADLILIDAPPLLPVTDAAVLGALTSGVVILARSNKTRREQLKRSSTILSRVGATTLGCVLNMVPTKGPDAYAYGYGYGYSSHSPKSLERLSRQEAVVAWASDSNPPPSNLTEAPKHDPVSPALSSLSREAEPSIDTARSIPELGETWWSRTEAPTMETSLGAPHLESGTAKDEMLP